MKKVSKVKSELQSNSYQQQSNHTNSQSFTTNSHQYKTYQQHHPTNSSISKGSKVCKEIVISSPRKSHNHNLSKSSKSSTLEDKKNNSSGKQVRHSNSGIFNKNRAEIYLKKLIRQQWTQQQIQDQQVQSLGGQNVHLQLDNSEQKSSSSSYQRVISPIDFYPSALESEYDLSGVVKDAIEIQNQKASSFAKGQKNSVQIDNPKMILIGTKQLPQKQKQPSTAKMETQTYNALQSPQKVQNPRNKSQERADLKNSNMRNKSQDRVEAKGKAGVQGVPLNKEKFSTNTQKMVVGKQGKASEVSSFMPQSSGQKSTTQQKATASKQQQYQNYEVDESELIGQLQNNNISTLPAQAQKNKLFSYLQIQNKSLNSSNSQSLLNTNRESQRNANLNKNPLNSKSISFVPQSQQADRSHSRSVQSKSRPVSMLKQTRNQPNQLSVNNNKTTTQNAAAAGNAKYLLNYGMKTSFQKGQPNNNSTLSNNSSIQYLGTKDAGRSLEKSAGKSSKKEATTSSARKKSDLSQNRSQKPKKHNEYNNNDEDYQKFKKDDVLKRIFKNRKDKLQSWDISKDALTHQASSQTFDEIGKKKNVPTNSYSQLGHYHEMHEYTLSMQKKTKKAQLERTHTPPPQISQAKVASASKNKNSNEKAQMPQSTSSNCSKKQTPYVNPKNPDDNNSLPPSACQISPNYIERHHERALGASSKQSKATPPYDQRLQSNKPIKSRPATSLSQQMQGASTSSSFLQSQKLSGKKGDGTPTIIVEANIGQRQVKKTTINISKDTQNVAAKAEKSSDSKLSLKFQTSLPAHQNTITGIEIDSYNTNSLFSASLDSFVKHWKLPRAITQKGSPELDLDPLTRISNPQRQKVTALLFIASGNILATGGFDKMVRLYGMREQGKQVGALRGGHMGVVNSLVRISEEKIASGCADHFIRIFDVNSKNQQAVQCYEQGKSGVEQIKALDQHCLVSYGQDRNAYVWDLRIEKMPAINFVNIHSSKVTSMEVIQSKQFVTTSDDLINFWDLRTKKNLKYISLEDHCISSALFIKKKFLVVAHESDLSVFNAQDNFSSRQTFQTGGYHDWLNQDLYSTAEEHGKPTESKAEVIKTMAYSEQDRKLYTGGFQKRINVWSVDFS